MHPFRSVSEIEKISAGERSEAEKSKPPFTSGKQTPGTYPLVVDLDGTLTKVDTLWEGMILLVKKNPFYLLLLPLWLSRGKAYFKQTIAGRVRVDVTVLPYNAAVMNLVRESHGRRPVVLASASARSVVEAVANHIPFFDTILATGNTNLSGGAKAEAIREALGNQPFDYVGNSPADLPVWNQSRTAYVVRSKRLAGKIKRPAADIVRLPDETPSLPLEAIKAMRPHQWVKNALLFLPLLLAHELGNLHKLELLLGAVIALCLCASGVYIVNDLLDIESDRYHSSKRKRPFACGTLSVAFGLGLSAFLLSAAAIIGLVFVSPEYLMMLGGYAALAFVYSIDLKRRLAADVITLSGLYTFRIFAGSVAAQVPVSPWMLAFSVFFFLSLAFVKRYVELKSLSAAPSGSRIKGRGYELEDAFVIASAGLSCGYMSILVFFLYLNGSAEVHALYRHPQWLWLIGPLLAYWITRVWFLARRGLVNDDPVVFAIKDPWSFITGAVALGVVVAATVF